MLTSIGNSAFSPIFLLQNLEFKTQPSVHHLCPLMQGLLLLCASVYLFVELGLCKWYVESWL